MHTSRLAVAIAARAVACVSGCGEDADESPAPTPVHHQTCDKPNRLVEGRCLQPGFQDDGCPAGTLGLEDGSCQPAGVPGASCPRGFVAVAEGCDPVLPADLCERGKLALPGETICRDVMPCGADPWGDIPIDDATQFVDASYAGTDSDGSASKPWTTVTAAVAAAPAGGLVAIAAGSYVGKTGIEKPLRVWGRCPGQVELVAVGNVEAIGFLPGSDGSELHGVAVRGGPVGVAVTGAQDITIDRVWAHDSSFSPIQVTDSKGAASATVTDSLVESGGNIGIMLAGADLVVERSAVRDTRAGDIVAAGIGVQEGMGPPSNMTLRSVVVERNDDFGVFIAGGNGTIEDSVVRLNRPNPLGRHGRGVQVEHGFRFPASLALRRTSLLENHDTSVFVLGATATIEDTTIRRTQPTLEGVWGVGLATWPQQSDGYASAATLRRILVEDSRDAGIIVSGTTATIEGVVVRRTQGTAANQAFGLGMILQRDPPTGTDTTFSVRGVVSDNNLLGGLVVHIATGSIQGSVVQTTGPEVKSNTYGDGLTIAYVTSPIDVTASVFQTSSRAGISLFGGRGAKLASTAVVCNPIALDVEPDLGMTPSLSDEGGNVCGCEQPAVCSTLSSGLTPPPKLEAEE